MKNEKNVKDMDLKELRKEMMELMGPGSENWKRRKEVSRELRFRLTGTPGWSKR